MTMFSVEHYLALIGEPYDRGRAVRQGQELKKLCQFRDILPVKISDERLGSVNAYPEEIRGEYFGIPVEQPINSRSTTLLVQAE